MRKHRETRIYAEGVKQPLSGSLRKTAISQFRRLSKVDLSVYTYEHHKTEYPEARADLTVFDGAGKMVFHGREFGGNQVFFWEAHTEAVTP